MFRDINKVENRITWNPQLQDPKDRLKNIPSIPILVGRAEPGRAKRLAEGSVTAPCQGAPLLRSVNIGNAKLGHTQLSSSFSNFPRRGSLLEQVNARIKIVIVYDSIYTNL